jgi:hypothetical protein
VGLLVWVLVWTLPAPLFQFVDDALTIDGLIWLEGVTWLRVGLDVVEEYLPPPIKRVSFFTLSYLCPRFC